MNGGSSGLNVLPLIRPLNSPHTLDTIQPVSWEDAPRASSQVKTCFFGCVLGLAHRHLQPNARPAAGPGCLCAWQGFQRRLPVP